MTWQCYIRVILGFSSEVLILTQTEPQMRFRSTATYSRENDKGAIILRSKEYHMQEQHLLVLRMSSTPDNVMSVLPHKQH
jgi:hypothetical protein